VTYSRIIGTGSYLPEKILTNFDLEKLVDTNDKWITERTGIKQRHIVAENQTTCDLAKQAALKALQAAQTNANDIDLIILATTTPDRIFPSTACLLQAELNIEDCIAFDIQAVCTGFLYAISVADKFIRSGSIKRALVIGAESFSRIVDWQDRNTCILFGDGAGAVVLEASDKAGIHSTHLHANGKYANSLTTLDNGFVSMRGNEVFKIAVKSLSNVVDEALIANNLNKKDIDWLVPHQANMRIINAVAKKLNLPIDKVIITVDKHGNTSAASVPLALDTAVRDGRIKTGDTLLLEAMGGGFTWGSALVTY
jgi:3-oxoacyl-[acyl-carrier-protein] synthase-3